MPYPSTPLVGALSPSSSFTLGASLAHLSLHQPTHRTSPSPASCMRQSLGARSPPSTHLISISSALSDLHSPASAFAGSDGYFSSVYEGATRTPGCSPAVRSPGGNTAAAAEAWNSLFGLEIGSPQFGHQSQRDYASELTLGGGGAGGGLPSPGGFRAAGSALAQSQRSNKTGGLRISDLPPFVMSRLGTWGSEGSDDSDTTVRDQELGQDFGDDAEECQEGVSRRMKKQRTATPFPAERERDEWLEDGSEAISA